MILFEPAGNSQLELLKQRDDRETVLGEREEGGIWPSKESKELAQKILTQDISMDTLKELIQARANWKGNPTSRLLNCIRKEVDKINPGTFQALFGVEYQPACFGPGTFHCSESCKPLR